MIKIQVVKRWSESKTWRKAHAFHNEHKPVSKGSAVHNCSKEHELKIELTSLKEAVKRTQSLNLLLLNWV